ncbi:MAG: hydantoinase B/oxoprolinase family protein [Roseovarius sp.]|nr:hydantoinase B/oxoprolinase family protein [Roseovarius sp.]
MPDNSIDPVSLEIIWSRLTSAVDEAAATFARTSFSSLVRDANDYAVVLTDRQGRSLAQSSMSIPSFISTLPRSVRHFLDVFPMDDLKPGDVLITNDPWHGTGHIHDVTTARPLFRNGKLVAFSAVTSHVPDIGGPVRNSDLGTIFEEGLQIPRLKLVRAGEVDHSIVAMIGKNVRVPAQTMGDIWGQVSAHNMLQDRLDVLLDETAFGIDLIGGEIFSRSERALRRRISDLPDGEYNYVLKNDGFGDPIVIDCTVKIEGDRLSVDYAGSSEQIRDKSINVAETYTFAYTVFGLKSILAPDIENNEGFFAPFKVTAPKGSIVNAQFPVATGARGQIGHLLPVAVLGALRPIFADRKMAEGSGNSVCTMVGQKDGVPFAVSNFLNAGQGATMDRPGYDCVAFPSNLGNLPIETFETDAPVLVRWKRIRQGSGGAGHRRGGNGQSFCFEYVGDAPANCSFLIPRRKVPPKGAEGGENGAPARLIVNGTETAPYLIKSLAKGDVVHVQTAGGGGFGARGK